MSEAQAAPSGGPKIKRFMLVNRKAPYGTIYALESLEVVLIAATFDQDVSLVFIESDKAAEELLNLLELESGGAPDSEVRIQFLRHHRSTSGQGWAT